MQCPRFPSCFGIVSVEDCFWDRKLLMPPLFLLTFLYDDFAEHNGGEFSYFFANSAHLNELS